MNFLKNKFHCSYNDVSAIKSIMSGLAERISTKQLYEQVQILSSFIIELGMR